MPAIHTEENRNDAGLVNVLTGMGVSGRDKTVATQVRATTLLSSVELEQLYQSGIPRRYIDAIADEILRNQVTITLGGDEDTTDTITNFDEYLKQVQFHEALSEVIKLQRLYGGAGLVMLIDDGVEDPAEEVDYSNIRGINGFVALSRWELIPQDVGHLDYNKPTHYQITTSQKLTLDQKEAYVNISIHHTRVARFDGLYLPWRTRITNTGWGQSCLQLIWEAYKRYKSAMSGLESMASDVDLFVHKMPGLFQRIAAGGESDLRKRLEANSLSRSVYGGILVDTEEEVDFITRALGNLSTATEPFIKELQAETGWPASILMGESPGGLGKEGRFEERVWASLVEQWQSVYCRTPITEIFTYILASKEGPTRGKVPPKWDVHFKSVFTQTEEEKAALRLQIAQVDVQYVNIGALQPIEIRESRFSGTEYSMETTLNEKVSAQLEAQADGNFETQMLNMQSQQDAMMNPPSPEPPQQDPNAAPAEQPAPDPQTAKNDTFELYSARNLRIHVTHSQGDIKAGYLVGPDGQRTDSSNEAPLMVFGPNQQRSYKLYRARFRNDDDELLDGPYVTGFASLRAAKQGVASLFPQQTVAGLSAIPEAEVDLLKAGWEAY